MKKQNKTRTAKYALSSVSALMLGLLTSQAFASTQVEPTIINVQQESLKDQPINEQPNNNADDFSIQNRLTLISLSPTEDIIETKNTTSTNIVNNDIKTEIRLEDKKDITNKQKIPTAFEKTQKTKLKTKVKKSSKTREAVAPQPIDLHRDTSYLDSIADIETKLLYNKQTREYLVEINKTDNTPINGTELLPLDNNIYSDEISPVHAVFLDARLNNIQTIPIELDDDGQYLLKFNRNRGKCEAVYIIYKTLKDNKTNVQSLILNSNGNIVNNMPQKCIQDTTIDKDDIQYTKNGYTVATNFTKSVPSVSSPITFNVNITKDGQSVIPEELNTYIVSKDFSTLYLPTPETAYKHKIFGQNFDTYINSPGSYFIITTFADDLTDHTQKSVISKQFIE